MKNEIYLRRKNKILLPYGAAQLPETDRIAAMLQNIQSLGFCFSFELLKILETYTAKEIENLYFEIVPILKKAIGDHVKYQPMYPNFPEQVMNMLEAELYWNALLQYASGGYIVPDTAEAVRFPLWDNKKLHTITLGTEEDFCSIFSNIMQSKSSISNTDKEDLAWFFKTYANYSAYLPKEIPIKENAAYITKLIFEQAPLISAAALSRYFKTATDVLRLITALSNGDISLAKDTRYSSFKRRERRVILELLEGCGSIEEDMNHYKNRWIRIGERLHPGEYQQFKKINAAFYRLRNGKHIYSFGGAIAEAMKQYNIPKAISLLEKRPGELARRLDHLLRDSVMIGESDLVIDAFAKTAKKVDSPVLLQVRAHFKNRACNQSPIRVFFPKGNIAKAQCIENKLPFLSEDICKAVTDICDKALVSIYQERETLGKTYINKELQNYLVPFSQRTAGKAFHTVVRGSRLPLEQDTRIIRTFLWWKNGAGRTDLDLSAMLFDENWKYLEHISFTNLKSKKYHACHSGDIVNAPNGASEFIDVDIASLKRYGCRFLAFMVLSYTGQKFSELPECFVGFMERLNMNSGEIYEPTTVKNKMDITTEGQTVLPVLFDIETRQFIWTDLFIKRNINWYNTVEANNNSIVAACRSMVELQKPNLYDLFLLHAQARGELCDTKEEANIIFDTEEGITPYDLDIIAANYL